MSAHRNDRGGSDRRCHRLWSDAADRTKGGFVRGGPEYSDMSAVGNKYYLRQAAYMSMRRLGLDHIDLYYLHTPTMTDAPFEEIVQTLHGMRQDGLIRHIGLSNISADQLRTALSITDIAAVTVQYTVAVRNRPDAARHAPGRTHPPHRTVQHQRRPAPHSAVDHRHRRSHRPVHGRRSKSSRRCTACARTDSSATSDCPTSAPTSSAQRCRSPTSPQSPSSTRSPFEIVQTLHGMRQDGLIRHIGLSNISADQLRTALSITDIAAVTVQYTVAVRDRPDAARHAPGRTHPPHRTVQHQRRPAPHSAVDHRHRRSHRPVHGRRS